MRQGRPDWSGLGHIQRITYLKPVPRCHHAPDLDRAHRKSLGHVQAHRSRPIKIGLTASRLDTSKLP